VVLVDLGDVIARDIDQRGRVLLVLDNAEHVIEAAATTVTRLLAEAPDCSLLVTSREAMRIAGEALVEVGPLDLAGPAVELFVDRVRVVRPGNDPGPDELALIQRVVALLEGIPLAIELAAGRLRAMGAGDLLERLPGQLEILSDRTRGPHHRQATLRAAIDWSWALLSPAEKGALAQSSVFASSFDLAAAERVLSLGAGESVLDTVQGLVDKSLLRIADSGSGVVRYGLLASIREYGAERLVASGAAAATLARHEAHFLGRAALHVDQFHVGPRRDVTGDFDDLLAIHQRALAAHDTAAALSAALALDPFFEARGPAEQRLRLLDGALRLAALHPPVEREAQCRRARAHLARAHATLLTGRAADSRADVTSAGALALEMEDAELAGRAKMMLGYLLGMEGRDGEGVVQLEAAASQLAGVAPSLQGVALVWLAGLHHRRKRAGSPRLQRPRRGRDREVTLRLTGDSAQVDVDFSLTPI
jgi:predicted ATPase